MLPVDPKMVQFLTASKFTLQDIVFYYDADNLEQLKEAAEAITGIHFEVLIAKTNMKPVTLPLPDAEIKLAREQCEKHRNNPERVDREIWTKILKYAPLGKPKQICLALNKSEKELNRICKKMTSQLLKEVVEQYNAEAILDIGAGLLEKARVNKDGKALEFLGTKLIQELKEVSKDVNINVDNRQVKIIELPAAVNVNKLLEKK